MSFKLTIAIPTYQRADALERLLECLCGQPGIEDVQVVVSDNGSSDRTIAVLDAFSLRLRLKRTGFDTNRGFDANYLNCVTAADGDYLWVLGDDDCLVPHAVEMVLASITADAPDILVCNGGDLRNGSLVPRVAYPVGTIATLDSLMWQVGWHLCWIGTCVVRRTLYRPDSLAPGDLNAFVHLPLLAGALRLPFRATFIRQVMLHTTINHSGYFADPRVLIETFGHRLHDTLACLGTDLRARRTAARIVRAFHDRLSMFGLRDFIAFRADARFTFTEFVRRLRFVRRLNFWAPSFAVLYLLPREVLDWSLSMYRRRRARARPIGAAK